MKQKVNNLSYNINILDISKNKKWNDFYRYIKISKKLNRFLNNISYKKKYRKIDITKIICSYIRNNNLINKNKIVIPDDKLINLFSIKNNEKITLLNIQKFITPHIIK